MSETKGATFDDFYSLLCVIRSEQLRQGKAIERMRMEMKLKAEKISYTLQEAADITGMSYGSLYNMVQTGKLRASQPSEEKKGKLVVTREELLRLISETEIKIAELKIA